MDQVLDSLTGPLAPLAVALLAVVVLTPLSMRVARALGAVARPSDERWHRRETPLLGGAAVTAGLLVGILAIGGITPETLGIAVARHP